MTTEGAPLHRGLDAVHREKHAYTRGEERPLGSFLGIIAAYSGSLAARTAAVRASGREPPERLAWSDLALVTVATHEPSRPLAKDPVAPRCARRSPSPPARGARPSSPSRSAAPVRARPWASW